MSHKRTCCFRDCTRKAHKGHTTCARHYSAGRSLAQDRMAKAGHIINPAKEEVQMAEESGMITTPQTIAAAKQIGERINVLVAGGVVDRFEAIRAALQLTPRGDTPQRHAILEAIRNAE